jgi:hypothetical protein
LRGSVLLRPTGHRLHTNKFLVETKLPLPPLERLFRFLHGSKLIRQMLRAGKRLDPATAVIAYCHWDAVLATHTNRGFRLASERT